MEKIICLECGSANDYELRDSIRKYEGEDYNFSLNVKVPFCKKCGAPVVIEKIEKDISERANEKIRESRGIIKRQEINAILSKYNISQKALSRLLGWGEITLTRYISGGYTPNITNSNKLKSLSDPYVFQQLLNEKMEEGNIEFINENLQKKLQLSLNENIQEMEEKKGKIYKVVNWFLCQTTMEMPITHLALQKLLYFAQGWNRVWNREWLFENDCEAWVHGAVFRDVYDEFKKFKYNPLPGVNIDTQLSEKEIVVLQFVKKYYFDVYTAKSLEEICHLEEPYRRTRRGYQKNESCENIIPKENIYKYYSRIANEYGISETNPGAVRSYLSTLLLQR